MRKKSKRSILTRQVEDLKEQLGARADSEYALQEENRRLQVELSLFLNKDFCQKVPKLMFLPQKFGPNTLQAVVMRENCEKKRLSMENEQLSWKMNRQTRWKHKMQKRKQRNESEQSFRESEGELHDNSGMSISYCEGTAHSLPLVGSPRFLLVVVNLMLMSIIFDLLKLVLLPC